MYQITADPANRCVEVDFIYSYSDFDQDDFTRDLRVGVLKAKGGKGHFNLLVDFTRMPVMPQDRTTSARGAIEWCMRNGLRRSANVVTSMLSKMQLERLSADDRFRHFTSRDEAIGWLRSAD